MAENINKTNTAKPLAGANAGVSDNAWSQSTPPSQPEPKFSGSRLGALLALVAIIVLAGLFLIYRQKTSKPTEQTPSPSQIPLSSVNPEISPPVPPPVVDTKKDTLRNYFKVASPKNFREAFLDNLPDRAADDYIKYSNATDEAEKLKYARSFYMFLNNPAVNRNDPEFINFAADIRTDLEAKLGGPLF